MPDVLALDIINSVLVFRSLCVYSYSKHLDAGHVYKTGLLYSSHIIFVVCFVALSC